MNLPQRQVTTATGSTQINQYLLRELRLNSLDKINLYLQFPLHQQEWQTPPPHL